MKRRALVTLLAAVLLAPSVPARSPRPTPPTAQDAINLLLAAAARPPGADTVDTVKTGDPSQPLTGVVTTFMASVEVIEQAIAQGANLIITHEPTFYNHPDQTDWLAEDPVYQAKRKLLDAHGIVTFRFHDYLHAMRPDPIVDATAEQLGWADGADTTAPRVFNVPPQSLDQLVDVVKARLGADTVRVVGDGEQPCRRVGLLLGASGGRSHLRFLAAHDVDVLVVGELAEWETSEYVRDANRLGRRLGLIVTGHSASESLGMQWLEGWLQARLPGVPVRYVPAPSPLRTE